MSSENKQCRVTSEKKDRNTDLDDATHKAILLACLKRKWDSHFSRTSGL